MKKKEFIRSLKFLVFSAAAGVIQVVSFTLLNEIAKMPYWPAYLIALVLSVLFNFTVNRKFTFQSASNVPKAMFKVFLFYCVFTPLSTIGGDYLTVRCLWNEYLVLAITMVLNFVLEFLFCRFWVYGDSVDTNDRAQRKKEENH